MGLQLNNKLASVIVCTLGKRTLEKCISSLCKQTYKKMEIIIVCSDRSKIDHEIVRKVGKTIPLKLIEQNDKGVPNARNCGVKAAEGDVIAFIDDDAVADKGWLENLVKTYDFSANIGAVGGLILSSSNKMFQRRPFLGSKMSSAKKAIFHYLIYDCASNAVGKIFRSGACTKNFDKCKVLIEVDHLRGCNMSFRKDVLESVGFDENYYGIYNDEETDAFVRVKKKGLKIICNPKAIVFHEDKVRIKTYEDAFCLHDNKSYFTFKNNIVNSFPNLIRYLIYLIFDLNHWIFKNVYKTGIRGTFYFLTFGWIRALINGFKRSKQVSRSARGNSL